MKKLLYILLFIPGFAQAQDALFTASVNKSKVAAGERFQVTWTINKEATDFRPPNLGSFRVLSGPNQSTSMQWVNGQTSFSQSFSYILIAEDEGNYTLSPATIRVDGKLVQSNTLMIQVAKGSSSPPQQRQPQQRQQAPPQQRKVPQASQELGQQIADNLFLKVSVDKRQAYLGEQITATYKIYTRVNIVDNAVNTLPSLNGFWSQDIDNKGRAALYTENVDGVQYNVADLKETILFPQRTGTLEIDPLALDVVVRVKSSRTGHSLFDQFFGSFEDVQYTIKSRPVKIEVLPLPEKGRPENFSGAVGNYSIQAAPDKTKATTNQAINYRFTTSGKGNLKLLEKPAVAFPPDFEVYDPKITDNITVNASGVSGSRTYEYLLIPRHAGTFVIDPVEFSYFNPNSKTYHTLATDSFAIEVEKGEGDENAAYSSINKEDIKTLGSDIRYIKTGSENLKKQDNFFFGSWLFYCLILLLIALFAAFITWWSKNKKLEGDTVLMRSRKANKVAVSRLKLAKKYMEEKNSKLFYEEVFRALYGYLSDRLNIPQAELYKDTIKERLEQKNISQETVNKLFTTLEHCEFARFAPAAGASEQQVYNDAADVIKNMEEALK